MFDVVTVQFTFHECCRLPADDGGCGGRHLVQLERLARAVGLSLEHKEAYAVRNIRGVLASEPLRWLEWHHVLIGRVRRKISDDRLLDLLREQGFQVPSSRVPGGSPAMFPPTSTDPPGTLIP